MKEKAKKLYKSGKRSVLGIIFGRTMIILLLLAVQFFFLFILMSSAKKYIPYLFGSVTAFTVIMLLLVLNGKGDPSIKLSWCFFIGILPVFGALMYLFTQLDMGHRMEQRLIAKSIKECAPYKPDTAFTGDRETDNLIFYLDKQGGYPAFKNSDAEYFPVGEDFFKSLVSSLNSAEKYIFMEFFIIKEGVIWQEILDILIKKAAAGVDVRLLYDGTNAVLNLPYGYAKKLKKQGIKCKMYSPLRPFFSTRYNNRDHRKIAVIDGKFAYTGGVNLADEYANITHPFGHWKDTAVLIKGEAVNGFLRMFLEMWCYNERIKELSLLEESSPVSAEGVIIPYGDNPLDDENLAKQVYLDIINRAKNYVYIMTPYLILDAETENALKYASKRGVDVRLIVPSIPDHKYAYALMLEHLPSLIQSGVKIYSYLPGFVHAKVVLADGNIATVGTVNFDYRSLYLHFECGCIMYNAACIKDIESDFLSAFKECHLIEKTDLKKRGVLSKLSGKLLKAIAPLM